MEQEVIKIEELYLKILKILSIIKHNIKVILIFPIIFSIIAFFLKPETTYEASTTLILKNQGESRGILNLASRLGIGGKSAIGFDKIKAVGLSNNLIYQLCTSKLKLNDKEDFVGAYLIKYYQLDEKWANKPNLSNVDFSKKSEARDTVVNTLFDKLIKNIKIEETKEKLVLINMTFKDHDLCLGINNCLTSLLLSYFERFELDEDLRTKKVLQKKLDSVSFQLGYVENTYAKLKDESFNTIKTKGLVNLQNKQRNLTVLNQMFLELTTQLEMINFKILDKSSSFEILDQSYAPLKKNSSLTIFYLLFGFIIGFIFGALFFVGFNYILTLHHKVKDLV